MKAHKISTLRVALKGSCVAATFGLSLSGWYFLTGGHWIAASFAFCAAMWIQVLKDW
jgi:hypothetical protein